MQWFTASTNYIAPVLSIRVNATDYLHNSNVTYRHNVVRIRYVFTRMRGKKPSGVKLRKKESAFLIPLCFNFAIHFDCEYPLIWKYWMNKFITNLKIALADIWCRISSVEKIAFIKIITRMRNNNIQSGPR